MPDGKDGTGRGLVEFLEYAATKGLMNKNTAAAQKSAVVKVLGIDDDRWLDENLRELDVDQQVTRFQNLKKSAYSPTSLRTYESRFRSALDEYFRFLDDPGAYRPATAGREPAGRTASQRGSRGKKAAQPHSDDRPVESPVAPPVRDFLITYPFPLRENTMVYLQLPKDLTKHEGERLSRFVQSLAVGVTPTEEPPS